MPYWTYTGLAISNGRLAEGLEDLDDGGSSPVDEAWLGLVANLQDFVSPPGEGSYVSFHNNGVGDDLEYAVALCQAALFTYIPTSLAEDARLGLVASVADACRLWDRMDARWTAKSRSSSRLREMRARALSAVEQAAGQDRLWSPLLDNMRTVDRLGAKALADNDPDSAESVADGRGQASLWCSAAYATASLIDVASAAPSAEGTSLDLPTACVQVGALFKAIDAGNYTRAELAVMVQETLEGVTEGAEVEVLREALAAMASALDGSGSLSEQGATEVVDESIAVLYRECGPYWDIG